MQKYFGTITFNSHNYDIEILSSSLHLTFNNINFYVINKFNINSDNKHIKYLNTILNKYLADECYYAEHENLNSFLFGKEDFYCINNNLLINNTTNSDTISNTVNNTTNSNILTNTKNSNILTNTTNSNILTNENKKEKKFVKCFFGSLNLINEKILIISKRANKNQGTRFFKRGVDNNNIPTNMVETDILYYDNNKLHAHKMLRGSIPFFWKQRVGIKLNPAIEISDSKNTNSLKENNYFVKLFGLFVLFFSVLYGNYKAFLSFLLIFLTFNFVCKNKKNKLKNKKNIEKTKKLDNFNALNFHTAFLKDFYNTEIFYLSLLKKKGEEKEIFNYYKNLLEKSKIPNFLVDLKKQNLTIKKLENFTFNSNLLDENFKIIVRQQNIMRTALPLITLRTLVILGIPHKYSIYRW